VFTASALLIVLNLFTLKYNDQFPEIKGIFIALAIITGIGTFFISIVSAFQ
jgi:E3 ubiquitin-protein ligase DOA10